MENNEYIHPDELCHHGTKGMKWGIRRYQNKDGSLTAAGKKRYEKELEKIKKEQKVLKNKERTQKKVEKLEAMKKENDELKSKLSPLKKKEEPEGVIKERNKSAKVLSNQELDERIARMKKEKEYNSLKEDTDSVANGKKIAGEVLEKVGKDVAVQTLGYLTAAAVNKMIFKGEDAIDPKNLQNRRKK